MIGYKHSVSLDVSRCKGCITCLKRCPTEAIRIRDGRAVIDADRCIDCGQCIMLCPHKAKKSNNDVLVNIPFKEKYVIALPPPSLYGQFQNLDDVDYMLQGLLDLGFSHVFEVARAAELVTEYTRLYLKRKDVRRPVISSACPVVTTLIQLRFPYLCESLIPILSPMDIAGKMAKDQAKERHPELRDEDIVTVFISPCTGKTSYVKNGFAGEKNSIDYVVSMSDIYFELLGVMKKEKTPVPVSRTGMIGMSWAVSSGEASALLNDSYLAVDGIENVIKVLDELETGNYPFLDFIELNACSSGCVGGVLTVENPYLAKVKIQNLKRYLPVMQSRYSEDEIASLPDTFSTRQFINKTLEKKSGQDMLLAMSTMKKSQQIYSQLPEFDCGACGSPTCASFAEDVAKGFAVITDCPMLSRKKNNNSTKCDGDNNDS